MQKLTHSETGHACGERHYKSKLSDDDVRLMRELYEDHKVKPKQLAEKFDVSYHTVTGIIYYRSRYASAVRP